MSEIQVQDNNSVIESVVIGGDLSKLNPAQRVQYYKAVCESVGLNPLTRPFDYITLNKKLTLYARKDATDQLRKINDISLVGKPDIQYVDEWIIVTVEVRDKEGRTDADVGAVNRKDMMGNFGNALMKAVTKAKRRATLSICGLGMLDETEVETIPDAEIVEAEIEEPEQLPEPEPSNGSVYDAVVAAGKSDNAFAAKNALQNYCKTGYDTPEKAVAWMTMYRGWRDSGLNTVEAADKANAGEMPK